MIQSILQHTPSKSILQMQWRQGNHEVKITKIFDERDMALDFCEKQTKTVIYETLTHFYNHRLNASKHYTRRVEHIENTLLILATKIRMIDKYTFKGLCVFVSNNKKHLLDLLPPETSKHNYWRPIIKELIQYCEANLFKTN